MNGMLCNLVFFFGNMHVWRSTAKKGVTSVKTIADSESWTRIIYKYSVFHWNGNFITVFFISRKYTYRLSFEKSFK